MIIRPTAYLLFGTTRARHRGQTNPLQKQVVTVAPARTIAPSPSRWLAPALLPLALAVLGWSPSHASDFLGAVRNAASLITADELKTHVDVLADDSFEGREAGSRGGHAAAGYLVRELERRGLKPAGDRGTYFQPFGAGYRNVLALLDGSDETLRQEVIILGAHYDHVGYGTQTNSYGPWGYIHNGADDNASGISGVLETIDALSAAQPRPRRSILFAFFDGEEKGLLGSKHWVAYPTVPREQVACMLNVDMIGRMQNERVEIYGTRSARGLRRLVSESNALTQLRLDFTWEMKENSDHYSFFAHRIPVLMVHTGLHGDYHRPSDDVHRLNWKGMQQAVRLMFAVTYELASRPSLAAFRPAAFQEHPGLKERLERPVPDSPPRLGVVWQSPAASQQGLIVQDVTYGSPAHRAGIRRGDRLVKFRGQPIVDPEHFRLDILAAPSPATLTLERAGESQPVEVRVDLAGTPTRIGIGWNDDDGEPGTVVLTQVQHGSAAQQAGLRVRDRLYAVGGKAFRDSIELHQLLTTTPSPIELLIEREGRIQGVTLHVLPPNMDEASGM